jgi:hypothetical protein
MSNEQSRAPWEHSAIKTVVIGMAMFAMVQAAGAGQPKGGGTRHHRSANMLLVCMRQKMRADRAIFYNDASRICKAQLSAAERPVSRTLIAAGSR